MPLTRKLSSQKSVFLFDLKVMVELISSETYPILLVQSSKLQYVKSGFGGVSNGGFGVSIKGEVVLDIVTGTCNALGIQKYTNLENLVIFCTCW